MTEINHWKQSNRTLNLYRVGTPSIGETWRSRFTSGRDSGGLGTGVYAFRTKEAAQDNIQGVRDDSRRGALKILHNALRNPVKPRSLEATKALNKLSIRLARLEKSVRAGRVTWDDVREKMDSMLSLRVDRSGYTEDGGFMLDSMAWDALTDTPELRTVWGYDSEAMVRDLVEATIETQQVCSGEHLRCVQPINRVLYPRFDGIAPLSDAGGDNGTYGCVIFKEKVDECVGYETEKSEEVPAQTLSECWSR